MERGTVSHISGFGSNGAIMDAQGLTIHFSNSNIVGKDRSRLKAGDFVWFERIGVNVNTRAINIRRC